MVRGPAAAQDRPDVAVPAQVGADQRVRGGWRTAIQRRATRRRGLLRDGSAWVERLIYHCSRQVSSPVSRRWVRVPRPQLIIPRRKVAMVSQHSSPRQAIRHSHNLVRVFMLHKSLRRRTRQRTSSRSWGILRHLTVSAMLGDGRALLHAVTPRDRARVSRCGVRFEARSCFRSFHVPPLFVTPGSHLRGAQLGRRFLPLLYADG